MIQAETASSKAQAFHQMAISCNEPSTPELMNKHKCLASFKVRRHLQSHSISIACVAEVDTDGAEAQTRGFSLSHSAVANVTDNAFIHQYSAPEEVMVFPGRCLMCHNETETRMYPTKYSERQRLFNLTSPFLQDSVL